MADEIENRIRRLYAAIGATEESDPESFTAVVVHLPEGNIVWQDFSGKNSEADLSNQAHQIISNINHLEGPLKRWAKENKRDKGMVDAAWKDSLALRVIKDLCDNDKHGYPPRNGGSSKLAPKLINIVRPLQLTSRKGEPALIRVNLGTGKTETQGETKTVIDGGGY